MGVLLQAMEAEDGVRLPGSSRLVHRAHALERGVSIPLRLHQQITALAGGSLN